MEKIYADAVTSSLKKGASEASVVDGLVRHLKEEGRLKLLPGILRELKAKEARAQKLTPSLEVASEEERASSVKEAEALGLEVRGSHVNPSLIKGWRGRSGGVLVDRSGKKALIELYRNIITK